MDWDIASNFSRIFCNKCLLINKKYRIESYVKIHKTLFGFLVYF
jgi:hypothetical protein